MLDWWEHSERRAAPARSVLRDRDGVDPDDVIMDPDRARRRGLTTTVMFPARAIWPPAASVDQEHGHRSQRGGCRRRLSQDRPGPRLPHRARRHRRHQGHGARSEPGDVLVLMGRGPMGAGMEEIYQITSALLVAARPVLAIARDGAVDHAGLTALTAA